MSKLGWFVVLATGVFVTTGAVGAEPVSEIWGKTPEGKEVRIYTIGNDHGTRVRVADYGALLVSIETRDKQGSVSDITLSYGSLDEALAGGVFGSVIGRFANRISGGGFSIDGERFDLDSVNPKTGVHIHGGKTGFHRQVWESTSGTEKGEPYVSFSLVSPNGHEGYPGTVEVQATYRLTADNALRIEYRGSTDAPTPLNLTNHVYFNLASSGDVADHLLEMTPVERLVVDDRQVPTGEVVPVFDSPFDLRRPTRLGDVLGEVEGGGFDHCFVIAQSSLAKGPVVVAKLSHPESGRTMEVSTTKPGVQVYTANHFKGEPYPKWGGICFETQHFPDAPNQPTFPESVLRPKERYFHVTEFRFGVVE